MSDKEKIELGVQLYFDSMYESSAEKVREAFYPNAMITGYLETGLAEMTVDQFADFVAAQQPSPQGTRRRNFARNCIHGYCRIYRIGKSKRWVYWSRVSRYLVFFRKRRKLENIQ